MQKYNQFILLYYCDFQLKNCFYYIKIIINEIEIEKLKKINSNDIKIKSS